MKDDSRRRGFVWKLGAAVLVVVLVVLLGRRGAEWLPGVLDRIRGLGAWSALAFVALYALATVAWLPGSILTVGGGLIFGLAEGTAYSLAGALLGASGAFLIARRLGRSTIAARLSRHRRLEAVDEAIGREGWRVVFLLRLSPVVPFNALNYALGLTRVGFAGFVAASAVGMVPGTFLYVYVGHAAERIATAAAGRPSGIGYYVMLGLGLVATVVATVLVTRAARRSLREVTDSESKEQSRGDGDGSDAPGTVEARDRLDECRMKVTPRNDRE